MRSSLDLESRFEAIVIVTHGVVAATERVPQWNSARRRHERCSSHALLYQRARWRELGATAARRGGTLLVVEKSSTHLSAMIAVGHATSLRHAARRAGHRRAVVPAKRHTVAVALELLGHDSSPTQRAAAIPSALDVVPVALIDLVEAAAHQAGIERARASTHCTRARSRRSTTRATPSPRQLCTSYGDAASPGEVAVLGDPRFGAARRR